VAMVERKEEIRSESIKMRINRSVKAKILAGKL
jgi:hypothetical protein